MRKIIDLTGRKYGRWTVIKKSDHRYADRVVKWLCQCACGNQREVIGHTLKSGKSRSCGCLAIDLGRKQSGIFSGHYKHGGARRTGKVRLYRIWQNIKKRCNKPNHPDYKYYGAKGISLCDEWQDDFEAFRDWALSNGYLYLKMSARHKGSLQKGGFNMDSKEFDGFVEEKAREFVNGFLQKGRRLGDINHTEEFIRNLLNERKPKVSRIELYDLASDILSSITTSRVVGLIEVFLKSKDIEVEE